MIWVWLFVIVISVIFEAATATVVSIWFVPAGLVCILLAIFNIDIVWQIAVFFLVSALCLALFRRILKNKLQYGNPEATNCDRLIGKEATVLHTINNIEGCGEVKVFGQIWSARCSDDSVTIEEGELVKITKIEGVKLICEKTTTNLKEDK